MKRLKMFCLCLNNQHLEQIKQLNYVPVGVGNENLSSEFLRDNTKLSAVKSIQLFEGTGIQDLRDLLLTYTNNSKKYIFLGRSEYDDYKDEEKKKDKLPKLYHDGINAGYLYNIPNTSIIIVNKNTHSSTSFINFNFLCGLLYTNFNTIFNNFKEGGELLRTNKLWNKDYDFPVPKAVKVAKEFKSGEILPVTSRNGELKHKTCKNKLQYENY
jgi:hypothetical protein